MFLIDDCDCRCLSQAEAVALEEAMVRQIVLLTWIWLCQKPLSVTGPCERELSGMLTLQGADWECPQCFLHFDQLRALFAVVLRCSCYL